MAVRKWFADERMIAALNEADAGVNADDVSGLNHLVGSIIGRMKKDRNHA